LKNVVADASPERTFQDLSDKELADIEKAASYARHGWSQGITWDEILKSRRVLIVSEAGLGKTHECRARRKLLWNNGEAAFFVELASLSQGALTDNFSADEGGRFNDWLANPTAVATFFLDSIDELNLTLGSFEGALKRVNRALSGQLARARFVITSRPIPIDQRVTRDHAENGRNAILNALLLTTGDEGWHAKLQLAEDPLFLHFKDRALFLAREKLAEEADAVAWTDGDIISLERYGEAPPSTRDAMFAIMRDRLDDLDDLLLRDYSPREAWAGYNDERLMRRELARTFHDASNHLYTVDQEGATADEKETDVRLRSTAPPQQAVIEVKIGDDRWSGAVLRATLQDQIVNKYMAPEVCRVGCLLVTIPSDRHWVHPDTGERLDLAALIKMLNEEAERLVKKSGNTIRLMVKGLDLRPRLKREK
jgi:hypothetical protein